MFNKKQFVTLLVGGAIVFFITFGLFFTYFYYQGMKDPIVQQESIEVSTTFSDVSMGEKTVEEKETILPTTKVLLQIVDDQYKKITEKEVVNAAVMGLTKEELMERFSDYKLVQFDKTEVVLQKQLITNSEPTVYSLVIQEGMLGILEKGASSQFTSLNLSEDAFSAADLALLEGQGLTITLKQKIQLQQQPYYIEQILQNYNE